MKKIKIVALSFLIAYSFWGCEKDDICTEGTPTTPNVVIEFYDALNPANLKAVTNLKVIATGYSGIPANGVSKMKIPLKTNEDTTTFQFIQNGNDEDATNDNIDIITFNYSRNDVFISRACGYKTVFQLNENNPVLTDGDSSLWISTTTPIEASQPNIQNENETHIKIYF